MTADYTPEMARAAVERGTAWLDKHCPDWLEHIDLQSLDLANAATCVLGQTGECITGAEGATYHDVLFRLDRTEPWATTQGFCTPLPPDWWSMPRHEYEREYRARFEVLTLTWREYIRERLAVPA